MTADFATAWAELESERAVLVEHVRSLGDRGRQPGVPGGLSPLATIEHLARTEKMYQGWIEKAAASNGAGDPKPNFIYRMVRKRMHSAKAVPTTPGLTPATDFDLDEAAGNWAQIRQVLESPLKQLAEAGRAFRHPVFGRMGADDYISLTRAHIHYHRQRMP